MSNNTVNRAELAQACALVRPAIASQPYIPALVHIAFNGKRATAYDDKSAISVTCKVPVERLVPGVLLIQALASFTGAEVLFQQADDKHLKISSGRANVKLPTLGLDAFPFKLPEGTDDSNELDLDDEIIRGIERCLISVNNDASRPAQMGVTMDVNADGRAVLYSTDNVSISRFITNAKVKLPGDAPVIMPKFFCEQLITLRKAFPKEENYIVLRADSLVAYFGDEATLFSRVPVDMQPTNFGDVLKRFIPANLDAALVPIPDSLDAALGRALLVLSEETRKTTEVECGSKGIKLKSTSSIGDADDTCEGNMKGQHDDAVRVDPTFLARASKVTTRMGVTPKVTVFADDKAQFVHVIAHVD